MFKTTKRVARLIEWENNEMIEGQLGTNLVLLYVVLGNLALYLCEILLVPGVERLVEVVQVVLNHILLQLKEQIAGLLDGVQELVRDGVAIKHRLVTGKISVDVLLSIRKQINFSIPPDIYYNSTKTYLIFFYPTDCQKKRVNFCQISK